MSSKRACQGKLWLSQFKINGMLKFLYRKNRYLISYLKQLLCNALIQPHFNYACSAWYPNLNKKFKSKFQTVQNRSVRYCLELYKRSHNGMRHFEKFNCLPVSERFNQYLCSNAFEFFKETCTLVNIKQIRELLF